MDWPSATTATSNQDYHPPALHTATEIVQHKVDGDANLNTNDGGNLHSKTKATASAYMAHIANQETKLYNRAKMERDALALTHKIWNDQEREKREAHERRLRDSALQYNRDKEKRENRAAVNEEALQTLKTEREEHSQFTQQMHQKELEQSHRQKLAEYARRLRLELKRDALEEQRIKRIEEEEKKRQYKTLAIQQKIENAQERLKRETAEKIALLKQQSRTHSGKMEKLMNCRRSEECKAREVRRHSQEHSTVRDSRGFPLKDHSSSLHQNTWAERQMVINKLVEKQKKVVREEFEHKVKIKETKWKDNEEKIKALNKTILGTWAEKSAKREALRAMHLEKHSKNIKEYIASKAEQVGGKER